MFARIAACVYIFAFLFVAFAQEKKPDTRSVTPIADASQIKVLKAQKAVKDAQAQMATLQQKYDQLQVQLKDIQIQSGPVAEKMNQTTKALKDAVDEAAKAAGLDSEKVDFDSDTLTFKQKPEKK